MNPENQKYRYEKKFVINNSYNFLINKYVKTNKLMFVKQFEERVVNTIYFDSNNLDLYRQNINGLNNRKKVRIRWYSSKSNFFEPILEIKIKKGNLGEKIKIPLKKLDKYRNSNFQDILNSIFKNKYDKKLTNIIYNLKPTLFVKYERNYFLSRLVECRLTIDKNINFRSIKGKKINNLYRSYNKSLIELKYPQSLDNFVLSGINEIPFRIAKHSKYVEGINMIN